MHVAQNTYSSYERGVIQPTLTTIMHLATLYSLSEEIFFHPDKWNHLEMLPQTNPNLHTPMDRTCLTTKEQLLIATIRQIDSEKIQICCIEKLIEWIQLFTCQ